MDIQIEEMLAEIETQASFEGLDPENTQIADLPEDSKISMLVNKLIERQKEMEA